MRLPAGPGSSFRSASRGERARPGKPLEASVPSVSANGPVPNSQLSCSLPCVQNVFRDLGSAVFAAAVATVALGAASRSSAQEPSECFTVHGRLTVGNGTPAARIWPVGTRRMLGVPDGPQGDELASLPANVRDALGSEPFQTRVFADFRVCPLMPDRPGWMRMVRVHSARITAVRYLSADTQGGALSPACEATAQEMAAIERTSRARTYAGGIEYIAHLSGCALVSVTVSADGSVLRANVERYDGGGVGIWHRVVMRQRYHASESDWEGLVMFKIRVPSDDATRNH